MTDEEFETIHTGPGYDIVVAKQPHTAIPYGGGFVRDDGTERHPFVDLRDRPDLAEHIHEAKGRAGLTALIQAANEVAGPFLSTGCEGGYFEEGDHAGFYLQLTLRNLNRAKDKKVLISLAEDVLRNISPSDVHDFSYRFEVERFHIFYEEVGVWGLCLRWYGRGGGRDRALAAADFAAHELARSVTLVAAAARRARDAAGS